MQEVLWIMRCEWIERCWQIVCSIQGSANLLLDLLVPVLSTQYNVPCFGWEHIRFHESKRVQILQMSNHHTDAFPIKKLRFFGSCIFKVWMTLWRITKLSISLNQFSHGWPSIGRKEPHRVRGFVNQHGRGDSGNSKASNQRAGHPGTTMLMVYYIYIYIWTGIEVFGVNY